MKSTPKLSAYKQTDGIGQNKVPHLSGCTHFQVKIGCLLLVCIICRITACIDAGQARRYLMEPAVCIWTSTESPEALDKGCFILSGISTKGLLQSTDLAVGMHKNGDYGIPVPDYIDTNVSSKVVKIIQSYTGIVDKMVWRKE